MLKTAPCPANQVSVQPPLSQIRIGAALAIRRVGWSAGGDDIDSATRAIAILPEPGAGCPPGEPRTDLRSALASAYKSVRTLYRFEPSDAFLHRSLTFRTRLPWLFRQPIVAGDCRRIDDLGRMCVVR